MCGKFLKYEVIALLDRFVCTDFVDFGEDEDGSCSFLVPKKKEQHQWPRNLV